MSQSKKELQQLMGIAVYWRKAVPRFSIISHTLCTLYKRGKSGNGTQTGGSSQTPDNGDYNFREKDRKIIFKFQALFPRCNFKIRMSKAFSQKWTFAHNFGDFSIIHHVKICLQVIFRNRKAPVFL